jgi:hypothetical protein
LPRVTPHGMESSETWIIDLRDRMPIVDDRPPPVDMGKIDEDAHKREMEGFREYIHGKDK